MLLMMPKIPELNDPAITDEMLLENKNIVEQMEEIAMSWEKHIQKASSYAFIIFPQFWVTCNKNGALKTSIIKIIDK